ncbi:hypothetical protein [Terriglobus roseus]|uniref:hypothetical protein n=1 Tax=Terriglobus roseus TaxID=392734 RepID=UPI0012EA4C84|nr:hypothetical protein [Terriglobus roseus]
MVAKNASIASEEGKEALVAAPAAFTATHAVIDTGLELVKLFQKDVSTRGVDTKFDPLAFLIELGQALLNVEAKASKVWILDLFVPDENRDDDKSVLGLVKALQRAKAEAWSTIAPAVSALTALDVALEDAIRDADKERTKTLTQEMQQLRRDLQPVSGQLTLIDKRFGALEKRWMETDAASGLSILARLLRVESLRARDCLFLHAAVVASGGQIKTIRSLWRSLFSGQQIAFRGGAVVRWALLGHDKSFIAGGVKTGTTASRQ